MLIDSRVLKHAIATVMPSRTEVFLIIDGMPDAIVRCKDCKHGSLYCTEDVCGETLIECNRPALDGSIEIHVWDWFCADGKRRQKDA